ncbi:hypothetical protein LINPERHAP2_LOCUS27490 [Linum perenne]
MLHLSRPSVQEVDL